MEEAGLPRKSLETKGSPQYSRMLSSSPSAAVLSESLIASAVADYLRSSTRSTTETVEVGTLRESPWSLPFSSGITRLRSGRIH